VKAARHEKVELDCAMDPGSSDQDKAGAKLEFRWSLNTSRDQARHFFREAFLCSGTNVTI
jgi:hypothetical protein